MQNFTARAAAVKHRKLHKNRPYGFLFTGRNISWTNW